MKQLLAICAMGIVVCANAALFSNAPQANATEIEASEQENFRSRLAELKTHIIEHGVKEAFASAALDALTPDPDVIRLSRSQPEHTRTPGDYINAIVSDTRIANGIAKKEQYAALLAKLEKKYGVPANVLVAIWGIESRYGESQGTRSIIRSLATLAAFDKRRANFWKRQLTAALRISERGDVKHDAMTGSWAGAMGHTQFIPTTFEAFGEDFDGDGKANIWSSPADALASAAHYLEQSGWRRLPTNVSPWGYEVALPDGFDYATASLSTFKPGSEWATLGVRCIRHGTIPATVEFALTLPQGAQGPVFLVTRNFRVILRYNNSRSYALAVAHLADRITGGQPIVRPWRNVQPLTRTQRMNLQEVLVARGYDTGGIDGILGDKSARAIRAEQGKRGLAADGFADLRILKTLQHNGFPHVGETQ